MRKKTQTRADLLRRILELEAQLASTYHFADRAIDKAGKDHMMASGVLLQLNAIGGHQIIPPVVIKDGLSDETIKAIKADLKESYELAVLFKP
ncbi:hypothetical protein GCM10023116_12530 [Kistimonas scapharcae]|uniref:Uncharacterized protein n=1 Tax=Kistimonas scapharcae TaxID=1036133 RepID=A0ABP8V066_9GAMM